MRPANEANMQGDTDGIVQQAIEKILRSLKGNELLALMGDTGKGARGSTGAQPLTQDMAPSPQYAPQGGGDPKAAKMRALFEMMRTGGAGPR
tara:strand:- start:4418 stop:4693 length:276 start_codon:yes stop_codon:yes gene_type:complete